MHIKENINNKKISFSLDINEYSDWTDQEYKVISGQFENINKRKPRVMSKKPKRLSTIDLPKRHDWRDYNAVSFPER